jgi:undecaprenyl phosphate N,N'-diacetylbacillosamine 1-phosphate transferase
MYLIVKRFFDFLFALLILLLTLPISLFLSITLWIHFLYENPFFAQKRPGKKGAIFTLVKFRTMSKRKDLEGNLLPDVLRLTSLGKILRKSSLDEIPQLINVLIGNMSFVGPRPLLPEYLNLYNNIQARRHHVTPGITGWAQVNGRNAISWEEKFQLDVWYVDNQSFLLDLKILFLTAFKLFKTKEVNMQNHATAEPFKGNSK